MQEERWTLLDTDIDVMEVWESFNGDLFFLIEPIRGRPHIWWAYVRLYHMPQFAEFGTVDMKEVKEAYGNIKVWPVTKRNWSNINTYEDNLLNLRPCAKHLGLTQGKNPSTEVSV